MNRKVNEQNYHQFGLDLVVLEPHDSPVNDYHHYYDDDYLRKLQPTTFIFPTPNFAVFACLVGWLTCDNDED